MKHHNQAFGKALKEQRLKRGKTQESLAFDTNLARNYISLLELGQRSPTLDTIMAISKALQIPSSELLAHVEEILATDAST